jgi:hypothetical protein
MVGMGLSRSTRTTFLWDIRNAPSTRRSRYVTRPPQRWLPRARDSSTRKFAPTSRSVSPDDELRPPRSSMLEIDRRRFDGGA